MKEKPTDSRGSYRAGSEERYMAYFKGGKHGDSPKQATTGKITFSFFFFSIFPFGHHSPLQFPARFSTSELPKRSRSSLWPKSFSSLSYLPSPQSPSESSSDRE